MYDDLELGLDEYAIKILLNRPRFHDGIIKLCTKWGVPDKGFLTSIQMTDWSEQLKASGERKKLDNDLGFLTKDLDLSFRWRKAIYFYLMDNNPYSLRVQSAFELTDEGNPDTSDVILSVSIRIDADTTEEELSKAFKVTRSSFADKKKKQLIMNIDRDLQVLKLHQKGKNKTEIADWLNINHVGTFNSDSVSKILVRIKRRLA